MSPWAQLAIVAAAFCLGRESLPSRLADATVIQRVVAPARQPPRVAPPRQPDIASVFMPAPAPAARPPRPHVRSRTGALPNRKPQIDNGSDDSAENPPYPVLSRVFFGVDPSDGTLPQKIAGPDPSYTGAALDHEVEGVMRVACVVTVGGEVDRCRVLQGLPYMDVAVLQALRNRRYEPARLADGQPVETEYIFVVRLLLRGDMLAID